MEDNTTQKNSGTEQQRCNEDYNIVQWLEDIEARSQVKQQPLLAKTDEQASLKPKPLQTFSNTQSRPQQQIDQNVVDKVVQALLAYRKFMKTVREVEEKEKQLFHETIKKYEDKKIKAIREQIEKPQ